MRCSMVTIDKQFLMSPIFFQKKLCFSANLIHMLTHVRMFVKHYFFALTDGSISIPPILIGRNAIIGKTFGDAAIRYSVLSVFS